MEKGTRKIVLPVLIEQDEDGVYVGSVPSLPGCFTQGENLPELYEHLKEVVQLYLGVQEDGLIPENREVSHFVKMQEMEFTY